jgi:hypothetical protein
MRSGCLVHPPQPVAKEVVPGFRQEPDSGGLVLLVLRRARRVVHVVLQRLGPETGRALVKVRQERTAVREHRVAPVRVDQNEVARDRLVGHGPECGTRRRPLGVHRDDAPTRLRGSPSEQCCAVLLQLVLVPRRSRDRQERLERRLVCGSKAQHVNVRIVAAAARSPWRGATQCRSPRRTRSMMAPIRRFASPPSTCTQYGPPADEAHGTSTSKSRLRSTSRLSR